MVPLSRAKLRSSWAGWPLILIGDAFHNFVDGIVIAAAFLTSIPLGITASIELLQVETNIAIVGTTDLK